MKIKQRSDYTFKYNKRLGRHGWLRLTPAYSVKLVKEIVATIPKGSFILDPFSGTATTGLVAAEQGLTAYCFDINPFLVWFGKAKCRNYAKYELSRLKSDVDKALAECKLTANKDNWLPNIHHITRWWSEKTLRILAALRQALANQIGEPTEDNVSSLAWIAFCVLTIETSSAAFNHVSMSFRSEAAVHEFAQIEYLYQVIVNTIMESASKELGSRASVNLADSREPITANGVRFSHVVTSPPYPNRVSYIRELRPYMYWTKFLDAAREAGELDWKAIGGTWGIATSRLKEWEPNGIVLPESLETVVSQILEADEKNALLMANYVWKYFHDMHVHFQNLRNNLQEGAALAYIVGNSSFYGVQVPTEKLLEDSLRSLGFTNVGSQALRKRNSKKELFEYCVYATWKENRFCKPDFLGGDQVKERQLALF